MSDNSAIRGGNGRYVLQANVDLSFARLMSVEVDVVSLFSILEQFFVDESTALDKERRLV